MSALICQHCGRPAFKSDVVNVFGAAEILRVAAPTVYKLLARGDISAHRISKNGRLRITVASLRSFKKRKTKVHDHSKVTAAARRRKAENLRRKRIDAKYMKLRTQNLLRKI